LPISLLSLSWALLDNPLPLLSAPVIRDREPRRNRKRREMFDDRDGLDRQRDELIWRIRAQVKPKQTVNPLLIMRWYLF
jgi:hypothetical protein